ncbi:TetR/AcrR family transcriptional regulator [Aquisalimonas sp.]|uniref:TetR/AcrR family transcriptional regulator n=1 Tax=Aquisalimonas sp. TaxID=1872621 RepID=UPI0025BE7926|nr:TetR/AcrR family transcriptional regulator [Aquisalimonas sp.]
MESEDHPQQTTVSSPWQPAAARDGERLRKREAVLLTAVRSYNEHGFHATSLDHVAGTLNITKPTIHNYFASKDEILLECTRRGLERIKDPGRPAAPA